MIITAVVGVAALVGGVILGRTHFGQTALDRVDTFVADLEKHATKQNAVAAQHDEVAAAAQANADEARSTAARASKVATTLKDVVS